MSLGAKRLIAFASGLLLLALAAAGGAALYLENRYRAPGPAPAPVTLVIAPGSGVGGIGRALENGGVIGDARLFRLYAATSDRARSLQAGEYEFPAQASYAAILAQMAAGRTVTRFLTVPEGLTGVEVAALVSQAAAMTGSAPAAVAEGALLPETYDYKWGQDRAAIVARMAAAMEKTLAELWPKRVAGLPLDTPQEALVLASIIEKETGIAEERRRVAGVFVNRLKAGMPLQADPTVVYALTQGKAPLGRALTRADWQFDSPYNTYRVQGLPPGPIANPGRASIEAALDPEPHDYLYFVADGSGGHAFARTLDEHNRNVARWRAVRGE
jgi:UPF0755 protein